MKNFIQNFERPQRSDLTSSLVVFIIAIPLSLGIALASGGSPGAGLLSAVIGGLLTGALSGAPLVVTGPAAGLTALVFQFVQEYGISGLAIITVLCGLFQIAMGSLRAGKLFTLIPLPVLEGVLSAIGLIIVLGQMHVLVGAQVPKSPVDSITSFHQSLGTAFDGPYGILAPVVFCGLLAIGVQLVWARLFKKVSFLPAALPAVCLITPLSLLWDMPRVELAPFLPTINSAMQQFLSFQWLSQLTVYIAPALGLAVVASAESLLTARAVDVLGSARPGHKPARLNKELMAQGVGNSVSGFLGGLPMTGVMVRASANINSGAKTRWSTMLHGLWVAVFVGALPFILTKIPLTALAAVLILTGVKLLNLPHLISTFKSNLFAGTMWVFTTAMVFVTDLLSGLLIALGTYALLSLKPVRARLARRNSPS